jgi:serine/threonine protein kinase
VSPFSATFKLRDVARIHAVDLRLALTFASTLLPPPCCHHTQGTPTHMSPELFMSGHVSKASDVYALGILLHELISGHRAYQGVPIPLLPHEVAVKGLRPKWPAALPEEYRDLQSLAEACWAQQPQDRCGGLRGAVHVTVMSRAWFDLVDTCPVLCFTHAPVGWHQGAHVSSGGRLGFCLSEKDCEPEVVGLAVCLA